MTFIAVTHHVAENGGLRKLLVNRKGQLEDSWDARGSDGTFRSSTGFVFLWSGFCQLTSCKLQKSTGGEGGSRFPTEQAMSL